MRRRCSSISRVQGLKAWVLTSVRLPALGVEVVGRVHGRRRRRGRGMVVVMAQVAGVMMVERWGRSCCKIAISQTVHGLGKGDICGLAPKGTAAGTSAGAGPATEECEQARCEPYALRASTASLDSPPTRACADDWRAAPSYLWTPWEQETGKEQCLQQPSAPRVSFTRPCMH